MTHNEDLIDKNDFLTEKGREILQLVLQDENESLRFFNIIRNNLGYDIKNITKSQNLLPPIKTETKEDLERSIDGLTNFLTSLIPRLFSDIVFMFNTFEIINSYHIKNKKNIEDLAEALTKSEQVRDDALRTIVERMEKDKENYQYDKKFNSEHIEKLGKTVSEHHRIVKYSEREYKDKAKLADGLE